MKTKIDLTNINEIISFIDNASESELIEINNAYCQSINAFDSQVFYNDSESLELLISGDIYDILCRGFYGDYNPTHDYVTLDGYGNLRSFCTFEKNDFCELVQTIAEYISENTNDFEFCF